MGNVIAVAQQKGGSGKTMLTAQFAVALAGQARVAVVDIDPQASLTAWGKLRAQAPKAAGDITVTTLSGWRLANEVEKLKVSHDYVFIDTPPVIDSDARRAIRGADLVLIPLNPAPPDLWAAEGTLRLAAEEKRRAGLVFNRAPATSRLRKRLGSGNRRARAQPARCGAGQSCRLRQCLCRRAWRDRSRPCDPGRRRGQGCGGCIAPLARVKKSEKNFMSPMFFCIKAHDGGLHAHLFSATFRLVMQMRCDNTSK